MANSNDGQTTCLEMAVVSEVSCCSDAPRQVPAAPDVGPRITALYEAVSTGDQTQVERALVSASPDDLNARHSAGTPLMLAAKSGAPELMQLLLQHGADPSLPDKDGKTPLHAAAKCGCLQSVQLLLGQSGVQVSAMDAAGLTALGVARSEACVRELAAADGALSPKDLTVLLRDRPAVIRQLLDLGVQSGSDGVLLVGYRALRDVSPPDCPFEAELVDRMQRSGCWQMLDHPAVQLLMEATRLDTRWMAVFSLVFMLVFLVVLCTVVMFDLYDVEGQSITLLKFVGLLVLNIARILEQLVRLAFTGTQVFRKLRVWPGITTTVLTFFVVFLPNWEDTHPLHAAAILSGFLELTLVIESISHWKATEAISSLLHVTRKIIGYLLMYMPILLGFALAFFVVLRKGVVMKEDNVFRGDVLMMTFASMVIGNVDVNEIKHLAQNMVARGVATAILILFLVLVPLVMLNMLLALTINDTHKFLSKGSFEHLRYMASMTAVNQRAAFSLEHKLRMLRDRLPGWLFRFGSSLALCVKWRCVLPRPFEAEGSSCVTLKVDPVAKDGKTVRVTARGSKRCYRISRRVRDGLDQIVQKREVAEADPPQTPCSQDRMHRELLQMLAGELRETRDMQKRMTQLLEAMREEMVKQLEAKPEGQTESPYGA